MIAYVEKIKFQLFWWRKGRNKITAHTGDIEILIFNRDIYF